MCFFLFTASFERGIENPRLFLCCLPLPSSSCVSSLLPSIFPVLLYLPLSFLDVRCVHIQHSPFSLSLWRFPLRASPSIIISVSAVPCCWESNVIIIFVLSSSLFPPLFASVRLPLIHYPSLTTLFCRL